MHIYVHVPFCTRRCSYCDFAIAVRKDVPARRFTDRVLQEWAGWQSHPAWGASPGIDTLYLGGGTPSLLEAGELSRLIRGLTATRTLVPDAEVTLEANPDDITPARADAWKATGINRISLGAQSFDPDVLVWMHRTHTVDQVAEAVKVLRGAGFSNLSLDLIFGLPAHLNRSWREDLDRALALEPEHLSAYGLTVEQHTPLGHWVERGEERPVPEGAYADEFLEAHARLSSDGFTHYEVSNYGRHGRRASHNSAYWRRAPYIGLGPSAHSGLGVERRWNLREWAAYDSAIGQGGPAVEGKEQLDARALRIEALYLGLRTVEGLDSGLIPPEKARQWRNADWLVESDGRYSLTPQGWLRMDALIADLL